MLKIIQTILLVWALCVGSIFGGTLNVITNNNASMIELNGVNIGYNGFVSNLEINKGSHLVQVKLYEKVVYSEQFQITDSETKTILVDKFVATELSPLANQGADQLEINRTLKSKGKFGVGLTYGVLPGISFRYRVNQKLGIEFTGFHFNFDSGENQDSGVTIYEGRGLYYLQDKMKYRMPATSYVTMGAGRLNDGSKKVGYADVSLGMEFSLSAIKRKTNLFFWLVAPHLSAVDKVSRTEKMFTIIECGYGVVTLKSDDLDDRYEGMIGRVGFRYYF